ncbi:hypothetical protein [Vreelandella janggokensis]|uniref:hypothetical protein n=1 Tax=Vreelandella janggokensis TaxID=370767 RepID=UPI0028616426|nr:hypothetical protein [Halomonas janggokensis]MDR5885980.1 hypothetical protein [Halomonas janggokensis]
MNQRTMAFMVCYSARHLLDEPHLVTAASAGSRWWPCHVPAAAFSGAQCPHQAREESWFERAGGQRSGRLR